MLLTKINVPWEEKQKFASQTEKRSDATYRRNNVPELRGRENANKQRALWMLQRQIHVHSPVSSLWIAFTSINAILRTTAPNYREVFWFPWR